MGRQTMRRVLLVIAAAIVLAALVFAAHPRAWIWWTHRSLANSVEIGWTRGEVIDQMGKPKWIMQSRDDVDQFCGGMGCAAPNLPVTKDVLVYKRFVWFMFVYMDDEDKVADVALART